MYSFREGWIWKFDTHVFKIPNSHIATKGVITMMMRSEEWRWLKAGPLAGAKGKNIIHCIWQLWLLLCHRVIGISSDYLWRLLDIAMSDPLLITIVKWRGISHPKESRRLAIDKRVLFSIKIPQAFLYDYSMNEWNAPRDNREIIPQKKKNKYWNKKGK